MAETNQAGTSHPTSEYVFSLALAAKEYAREQILKGSTQLENNNLAKEYLAALSSAVSQVRDRIRDTNNRNVLHRFDQMIAVTSKFSIGNCDELANQALDYILNYDNKNVSAEVYSIFGGDHVFW